MKNNKEKSTHIFSIGIALFIIVLSVGYAFFSDSLSVNGVASTVNFYSGNALPTNPIKVDTSNDRYFGRDVGLVGLAFSSESWVDDTYILIYDKNAGITCATQHTVNYTIRFSNPTELEYTNGQIYSEITEN